MNNRLQKYMEEDEILSKISYMVVHRSPSSYITHTKKKKYGKSKTEMTHTY